MRSVVLTRTTGPSGLEVREVPDPSPKPGEVRVRVHAAGVNFAEIMAAKGLYPDAPKCPATLGYEVAGVVDALGAGVDRYRVGDRVVAMIRFGGQAELVCAPVDQTFALPEHVSFEEGAAVPVNYLTAHHMLFEMHRLRAGDRVLVHQAAGGVGTAVLQLCATVPGVVTFGTASKGKHDFLRAQGCTHPIDYRSEDYAAVVHEKTGGEGVHLVLDALGGTDWKKGYGLLRRGGTLIGFGWANMSTGEGRNLGRIVSQFVQQPRFDVMKLMNDNRGVAGCNMGHLWDAKAVLYPQIAAVEAMLAAGTVRPHVDKRFGFDQAAEAYRWLQSGKNVGKVILVP